MLKYFCIIVWVIESNFNVLNNALNTACWRKNGIITMIHTIYGFDLQYHRPP